MIATDRVLIAGIGNIFLSDDGFGSAVACSLLQRQLPEGVRVVDYGIRGVHLGFDLADGVDLLILVDTVPEAGGPGSLVVREIDPAQYAGATFDAHSMDPNTVLQSVAALGDQLPRTLVVGCQPESVADGLGLSDIVASAVPIAAEKAVELACRELDSNTIMANNTEGTS